MREIRILPLARRDLVAGYRFYEKQAEGVGRYFLDTLYSDIESLRINAGIHAVHLNGYYRLLSIRFPWSVYYRLDSRRNPDLIRNRLADQQEP